MPPTGDRAVSSDPRIDAGLRAQAVESRRLLSSGARRLGWKAGFGTSAAMQRLGIDAPLVGFLTDRTLLADDELVSIAGWRSPLLEAEVAIRLGADVAPGARREHVVAAIEAFGPAIELVDVGAADDVEEILAGNIFHRHVALGELRPPSDDMGPATARVDVVVDGRSVATGADPSAHLGDLVDVVRRLADQLPAADGLAAGDVVITGAAAAFPLAGGERVEVGLRGAGTVVVRVAERPPPA